MTKDENCHPFKIYSFANVCISSWMLDIPEMSCLCSGLENYFRVEERREGVLGSVSIELTGKVLPPISFSEHERYYWDKNNSFGK